MIKKKQIKKILSIVGVSVLMIGCSKVSNKNANYISFNNVKTPLEVTYKTKNKEEINIKENKKIYIDHKLENIDVKPKSGTSKLNFKYNFKNYGENFSINIQNFSNFSMNAIPQNILEENKESSPVKIVYFNSEFKNPKGKIKISSKISDDATFLLEGEVKNIGKGTNTKISKTNHNGVFYLAGDTVEDKKNRTKIVDGIIIDTEGEFNGFVGIIKNNNRIVAKKNIKVAGKKQYVYDSKLSEKGYLDCTY